LLTVSRFGYFFDLAVVTETVTKQFPDPRNATSLPLDVLQTSLDILEILMVTFAPRGTFNPAALATCELSICLPLGNVAGFTKVEVGGFGAINSPISGAGAGVDEGDGATSALGDGEGSGALESDGVG
jgi:hypothetical protein